jgi:hypothetical protein
VAWARFDDEYPRHQKVQSIPPAARADAIAFELAALCYSSRVLSDGQIARAVTHSLALEVGFERRGNVDSRRLNRTISALLEAGRWRENGAGGYVIHDYDQYQPSASDVKERRAKEADKKRKQRAQGRMSLDLSPRDVPPSVPQGQRPLSPDLSPGESSRAGATGVGAPARPGPSPTHRPLGEKSTALPGDRSKTTANGLPVENERLVLELLAAIGDDADEGTPAVVRSIAAKLPEGAIAKVLESVRSSRKRNRAEYAVAALQGEWTDRHTDEHGSRLKELRREPEAWVRELGWKMPREVFDEALFRMVANEDERIRLADLAADLRGATAA